MELPKLKRIKLSTHQELDTFLRKPGDVPAEVMLVTCRKSASRKHISSADIRAALARHGWTAGRAYTLKGDLTGHVARAP